MIGSHQALEIIKIILGCPAEHILSSRMLLIDGWFGSSRVVKLRPRSKTCAVCGDQPTITLDGLIDYEMFCNAPSHDRFEPSSSSSSSSSSSESLIQIPQVSCAELDSLLKDGSEDVIVVDVREVVQFEICSLPASHNVPISGLEREESLQKLRQLQQSQRTKRSEEGEGEEGKESPRSLYLMCRRGVKSTAATKILLAQGFTNIFNVSGGLRAWHFQVDPSFPLY